MKMKGFRDGSEEKKVELLREALKSIANV